MYQSVNNAVQCKYWLEVHFICEMVPDILSSCDACLVVDDRRPDHQLMPFCTVAACFQECETKSVSLQKKKKKICSVCE